ncbi:MAG: hypothetical protein WBX18_15765, partial [Terracidiphilus sp.]
AQWDEQESHVACPWGSRKNLAVGDPEEQHQAEKRAKGQQCCRCAGSDSLHYLSRVLKIIVFACETCVFRPPAQSPEGKRRGDQQDEGAETEKNIMKSDQDSETRIARKADQNAGRQQEHNHRRVPQIARIAARQIDPGQKVSGLLRCFVVYFRATEPAHVRCRVDRLAALGAIEDVELFAWAIEVEFCGHWQALPQVVCPLRLRIRSIQGYAQDRTNSRNFQLHKGVRAVSRLVAQGALGKALAMTSAATS